MAYDIEEKDLGKMKYILDRMEESRYFTIDPTILNAVQLLSEQIISLTEDIEQSLRDSESSGGTGFDDFDEVLQLYLYDKDYS